MKILVLLASFLDSELPYTIKSCIENAAYPENIRFAVFLQHDNHDVSLVDDLPYDIKIRKRHYTESKGCGWARNIVGEMYTNEDYVLQIDSHSRMIKNWDDILVNELSNLGDNAIISYLPPSFMKDKTANIDTHFDNINNLQSIHVPKPFEWATQWSPNCGGYSNQKLTNGKNRLVPFVFCGFIFAQGQWLKDIPADPEMYYWGEEQSIYLRSWTHGYDIYLPKQIVAWHYCSTAGNLASPHHWDVVDRDTEHKLANMAYNRAEALVNKKIQGIYGLGSKRTLEEWMEFSGVDLINQVIHTRDYYA